VKKDDGGQRGRQMDGIMIWTHLLGESMSVRHAKTALMIFMRNGSDEMTR